MRQAGAAPVREERDLTLQRAAGFRYVRVLPHARRPRVRQGERPCSLVWPGHCAPPHHLPRPRLESVCHQMVPGDHLPWSSGREALSSPGVLRVLASGLNAVLSNNTLVLILRDFNIRRTPLQPPAISAPSRPLVHGACGLPLRALAS